MLEWKDVLATVGTALGSSAGDCVLDFLKILPEEVMEGRKIHLSVCSISHLIRLSRPYAILAICFVSTPRSNVT